MQRNFTRRFLALLALLLMLLAGCGGSASSNDTPTLAPVSAGLPTTPAAAASPSRTRPSTTRTPTSRTSNRVTPSPSTREGFAPIRVDQLPPEARDTLALIDQGGPFPYRQDGVVFQNREGLLPAKPNGYYHEYTVKTPGSPDRGARRIITGEGGEMYYTDDHYASFKRIVQ